MEKKSICNAQRTGLDLKGTSLSLSVTSNKGQLSVQNNCNRTEHLCGPPCVQLAVEREKE